MGQRIILSEEEKLTIQKMYGLINEQDSSNEPDTSTLVSVEDTLLSYLPILNKTENELKDIGQKEMVNQVMNTNETNRSLLNNINDLFNYHLKGTEFEERYERPFNIIKSMIQSQKIDGNYIDKNFKWFRDIIRLSKGEFEDFMRDVKNLEDLLEKYNITKDMVVENKDEILKQLKYNSGKVPKDLLYRIRQIWQLIDQNFIDSTGPRPTTDTVVKRPPTDDVADKPSTVRRRN